MHLATELLHRLEDTTLNAEERARLRCQLAKELEEAGNYEAARGALGELWHRLGERPRVEGLSRLTAAELFLRAGVLTGWIGCAKGFPGAVEKAKDLITPAMDIFTEEGLTERVGEALTELGFCYWRGGETDEARVTLDAALTRLEGTSGDIKATTLVRRAIVEAQATNYSEAYRILLLAESIVGESKSEALKGKFHVNMGVILKNLSLSENDAEQSKEYRGKALIEFAAASVYFERAGHTRNRALTENNLGLLYFAAKAYAEAHEHLDIAHRLYESLEDEGNVAQVNDTRARVLLETGDVRQAAKLSGSASRVLERVGEMALYAQALVTLGRAEARLGDFDRARLTLKRASETASQAGDREGAGRAEMTMIEELGERLSEEELRDTYRYAFGFLSETTNTETLKRLASCANMVLSAHERKESAFTPRSFVFGDSETVKLLDRASRVAKTDAAVLLTGETGVGKGVLAELIHGWSGRHGRFVAINCGAIPDSLIESQLFGHRKGSFTDAIADYPGAVMQAAGGTLFLDEIGNLSLSNQAKLLRFIENGEIHPVGEPLPMRVDVRVVAATNQNLQTAIATGAFRRDLYFRLQTFQIEIPPLRERPDDIVALAKHFILEARERYQKRVDFTVEAVEAMRRLPLKGNARELRAIIERTVLVAGEGTSITEEAVETATLRRAGQSLAQPWQGCSLEEEVLRYEGELIKLALEHSGGLITRAAKLLGTSYQTLQSKLARQKSLLDARIPAKKRKKSVMRTGKSVSHRKTSISNNMAR